MNDQSYYQESPYLAFLKPSLLEWRDGFARVSLDLRPELTNRSGVAHGGILCALLDHSAGISGLYCAIEGNRRYGMTVSLTTNFIGQSSSGQLLATGERVRSGRNLFFANSRIEQEDGTVIASATGVFRYRSGSADPRGVSARG